MFSDCQGPQAMAEANKSVTEELTSIHTDTDCQMPRIVRHIQISVVLKCKKKKKKVNIKMRYDTFRPQEGKDLKPLLYHGSIYMITSKFSFSNSEFSSGQLIPVPLCHLSTTTTAQTSAFSSQSYHVGHTNFSQFKILKLFSLQPNI